MEWLQQNEKFQIYQPNGRIENFINLVSSEESLVYILSASNALGKTAFVVNLIASLIWPGKNKYFQAGKFKDWKYPKRIRYITEPTLVKEIGPFHSEIEKWWPKGEYEANKAGQQYFSQYKANGWVVDVMTYEQATKDFEGGTLGLVVCDEPPPRDIFNACIGRLRLGGFLLVVMTPLTQAAWFYDSVVPNHSNHIIYGQVEDACITHGLRGHLDHSHIERMVREWPEDEVEARAHGKALYLSGLIFKKFDPRVHVLREPIKVPSNATMYQSVDPHSDKPFASIWGFPDQQGNLYIVDEWPNEDFYKMHNCQLMVPDYKNIFRDKEQSWNMHKRIIDRHFAEVTHMTGMTRRTLREELAEVGLDYSPSFVAGEEMETSILKVREYLDYDADYPVSNLNKPKLYINPHCQNTIRSFQRWARDSKTGKVKDDYKDFCDCVRYLVMDNPQIDEPIPYMPAVKMWGGQGDIYGNINT